MGAFLAPLASGIGSAAGAVGSGIASGASALGSGIGTLGTSIMTPTGLSEFASTGLGSKMGMSGVMGNIMNVGGNIAKSQLQQRIGLQDKWNSVINKKIDSGNKGQEYMDALLRIAMGR